MKKIAEKPSLFLYLKEWDKRYLMCQNQTDLKTRNEDGDTIS